VVGLAGLIVAGALFARSWLRQPEADRRPPVGAQRADAPGRAGPPPLPRDLQIRIVDDGFWVQAPGLPAQSVIRWRCLVGMNPQSGGFTYEPGPEGRFVYTGSRPRDVTIVEILPPEGYPSDYVTDTGIGPTSFTPIRSSSFSRSSPPPRPTPRHPPAY
jgi:hypothetical protein